ncbi:hypothetical protein BH09ACT10_BH09ACT10_02840 [soil metagenome]
MSDPRFEQRRHDARWHRIRMWSLVGGVVVLVGILVWVVGWSRVLAVRSVDVQGISTMNEQNVQASAAVPLGEPLIRVDTDQIEARVAAMKRVASVEVSRHWPRTLTITIVERTPVAWLTVDGQPSAIDRDGVVFRTFGKPPTDIVEIVVSGVGAEDLDDVRNEAAAAISAVQSGDPTLWSSVKRVDVSSRDGIDFVLTKDRIIHWGSASHTKQKLRVLDALLKIGAREYDVSAPDQPTTRS